ncbi:hypothetical protein GCM10029978_058530 [Actinoallomurus acanthiterrae]
MVSSRATTEYRNGEEVGADVQCAQAVGEAELGDVEPAAHQRVRHPSGILSEKYLRWAVESIGAERMGG